MSRMRDVWAPNLEQEMRNIRAVIDEYPYIAMDTEFPGVVARPIGSFANSSDYHYQTMRCNVDLLKIIQVGITLADEQGNNPPDISTWQFNFHFSTSEDMFAPESIDLLSKAGIDFPRHAELGIYPNDFAELMITSGLVLSPDTKWISFHSGYDFGYFVKLLTAVSLPMNEERFFQLLQTWFPTVYDIKFMIKVSKTLKGGLQEVADNLGVTRIGTSHQAGSDSLLTSSTFFKIRDEYFPERIDDAEYSGKLYGLGQTFLNGSALSTGGATIAEREDRLAVLATLAATGNGNTNNNNGSPSQAQLSTPGGMMQSQIATAGNTHGHNMQTPGPQTPGVMGMQLQTSPYGPSAGYMRSTMVGGGGR